MRRKVIVILLALYMTAMTAFATEPNIFALSMNYHARTATEQAFQQQEEEVSGHWESLGSCRVTTYCTACNSPAGHASATGTYLEYGHVACSWLPMYSHILIDGEEFVVVDVCGTEAIDIFLDGPIDQCICDRNYYTEVYIWKE